MKATWSGTIQFGLVALPIRLYAATEEHPVRLHETEPAPALDLLAALEESVRAAEQAHGRPAARPRP
ncbi:hypothetical protein ACIOHS_47260 [Streptomyces sp. NPDC088253]|uniref:hypothetical protein n=1 Tax=unclassified Streptomyces TaxID=2593676 RepID=UPI003810A4C5